MRRVAPERIVSRGRLVAALTVLPAAVAVLHARRSDHGAQRHGGPRSSMLVGLSVVSLLLQLVHARRVERMVGDLTHRSRTDPLTGVGNRWAFEDDLTSRLRDSRAADPRRRSDPAPTTLVLIDIDHFKSYNDRYGHPAGDEALARVAGAIRSAARRGDAVHRIGGEEFAVLLAAGHAESLDLADRIRRSVAAVGRGQITVSAGVATAGDDDAEALIDRADRALYRAKDRGRNRVDSHHTGPVATATLSGRPVAHPTDWRGSRMSPCAGPGGRAVCRLLVPDVGELLLRPLRLLGQLLGDLRAWGGRRDQRGSGPALPAAVVDCTTLLSVRRLLYLLEPTQGCAPGLPSIHGPDGGQPHTTLRPVRLPAADVHALDVAVRGLGHSSLPAPVHDLLTSYAGVDLPDEQPAHAADLVAELAALAGLLDLPVTPGARLLATRLPALRRRGGRVLLTGEEEAAYRGVLDQITVLWTAGSPEHSPLR